MEDQLEVGDGGSEQAWVGQVAGVEGVSDAGFRDSGEGGEQAGGIRGICGDAVSGGGHGNRAAERRCEDSGIRETAPEEGCFVRELGGRMAGRRGVRRLGAAEARQVLPEPCGGEGGEAGQREVSVGDQHLPEREPAAVEEDGMGGGGEGRDPFEEGGVVEFTDPAVAPWAGAGDDGDASRSAWEADEGRLVFRARDDIGGEQRGIRGHAIVCGEREGLAIDFAGDGIGETGVFFDGDFQCAEEGFALAWCGGSVGDPVIAEAVRGCGEDDEVIAVAGPVEQAAGFSG